MTAAFFVQNNYVEHLTVPVARYAHAHGIALEDRSTGDTFDPDACGIDWTQYDIVLPYGSVQFLRKLKTSSLSRFIHHDEHAFASSTWSRLFGEQTLNGGGQCLPAGDVADWLNAYGPHHLRPAAVDKAFIGAVCTADAWRAVQQDRVLPEDLLCWVSPVREIAAEWRCWVIGGQVVEISQYRQHNAMHRARETRSSIYAAAQHLADIYVPAPCTVLDMALTDTGFTLVEFNPIHCAGWYAADVAAVLTPWLQWSTRELVPSSPLTY